MTSKILFNLFMAPILFVTFLASVNEVYAYTWNTPNEGTASYTIYYGNPDRVAYYDSTNHELYLAVKSIVYESATVRGNMSVKGIATSSGHVRASIHWYIKAVWSAGAVVLGDALASITVKFKVEDLVTNTILEYILLDESVKQGGGSIGPVWLDNFVDVPLYEGHIYKFYLHVEVHAHAVGAAAAEADAGSLVYDGTKVKWGYISVPNTVPAGGGGGGDWKYLPKSNPDSSTNESNIIRRKVIGMSESLLSR